MKVLAVSTWFPTPAAPVMGVFVRKDVQALARDHDVTVLHLAPPAAYASAPRQEWDGPVRVRRVPLQLSRPDHLVGAARAVAEAVRDVDVLHTMAFSTLLPLALSRPGVAWVHTEHWSGISVPQSLSPAGPYLIPALAQVLRRPDVVVPVCEFLARAVRRYRRGPVTVVPCIVDRPEVTPSRPAPGPQLRLVAVGGLTPGKDPVLAVE
ncbi:MAG TPA: glycosyltransferase, partial [Intrasporangium sp.]|uniref:glycosyltransferase n=1 Tax=Intrasporangium sp. TaxID=1925024 RepID=UPI002D765FE8